MSKGVIVKEFIKSKVTEVEYGIFRARIIEDVMEDEISVEFGSIGAFSGDDHDKVIILNRNEFEDLFDVLERAHDLMDSIPDGAEEGVIIYA